MMIKNKVGNEFSSVEALWSQFENVMAKEEDGKKTTEGQQHQQQSEQSEKKGEA
jgi:DASH complex subunit DAD1